MGDHSKVTAAALQRVRIGLTEWTRLGIEEVEIGSVVPTAHKWELLRRAEERTVALGRVVGEAIHFYLEMNGAEQLFRDMQDHITELEAQLAPIGSNPCPACAGTGVDEEGLPQGEEMFNFWKDYKHVGAWIPTEAEEQLKSIAQREGRSVADLIFAAVDDYLDSEAEEELAPEQAAPSTPREPESTGFSTSDEVAKEEPGPALPESPPAAVAGLDDPPETPLVYRCSDGEKALGLEDRATLELAIAEVDDDFDDEALDHWLAERVAVPQPIQGKNLIRWFCGQLRRGASVADRAETG